MNSKEIFEYTKTPHTPEELLDHPCYSHSRFRERWTSLPTDLDGITVYFRCTDSPSGVLLAGGFKLTPENKAIVEARKLRANTGPSRGDIACRQGCGTVQF